MGFHLDLEYCCGYIEKIGLFDKLELQLDECCIEKKTDDCMHNDHVVKAFELHDYQVATQFQVGNTPSFILPLVIENYAVASFETEEGHIPYVEINPPPRNILHQVFLC